MHNLTIVVWYLHTDRVLTRNRRDNSHAGNAQCDCKVVGKCCDLVQPQTSFQLDFILRDNGASFHFDNVDRVAKLFASSLEDVGFFQRVTFLIFERNRVASEQHIHARQFVVIDAVHQRRFVQAVHDLFTFGSYGFWFFDVEVWFGDGPSSECGNRCSSFAGRFLFLLLLRFLASFDWDGSWFIFF